MSCPIAPFSVVTTTFSSEIQDTSIFSDWKDRVENIIRLSFASAQLNPSRPKFHRLVACDKTARLTPSTVKVCSGAGGTVVTQNKIKENTYSHIRPVESLCSFYLYSLVCCVIASSTTLPFADI